MVMSDEKLKYMFIINILLGAVLGFAVWAVLFMCGGYPKELDRPALLAQIIGSMLVGVVGMGGSTIYRIESLGILKATLIHYLLVMFTLCLACKVLGWFSSDMLIVFLLIETVIYAIIWLVNYFWEKRSVKEMNRDLELMKKKQDGDRS